ncbi:MULTISPECIES: nitroreductase family protein [unclassified Agarivorans]|uniref:nitroreductase family protein n=1 Tax=unclassified Agarivorans TaxID=2636026 RepID=UPI0026E1D407|nr:MULTISPECIES: nitroreductase [unclassified Agarivorans]MDO6686350.1 nitroreductase [Agarivorans sp. 3_MG-2023]MDO6713652.1 nitroreductase [Agarivorans sp. 2_MG-2023]
MNAISQFLNERVSYHVHELQQPAPKPQQMTEILQAAMSTPDHGKLKPWHFLVVNQQNIEALISLLQTAWQTANASLEPQRAKRLASYLKQAPSIVLVSAELAEDSHISKQDQIFSAAAACQMILLSADAQGFGGVWYSTDAVELPNVRHLLGLQDRHHPVGFLVIGSPITKRTKSRSNVAELSVEWQGAATVSPWGSTQSIKQEQQ